MVLKLLLCLRPVYFRSTSIVAFTWDVDPSTIYRITNQAKNSSTFTIERKKRCDTGQTILNSNKKCESVITAKFVFKKIKRQQTRGERLTNDEWFSP